MKLSPSRFSVRQPAPQFLPPSRAKDRWLAVAIVALVLLGALAEKL